MEISPQRVRAAEFKTVKRGLDPDEVRSFLSEVALELERAQNQSTAMEARARAAVARLQELSESTAVAAGAGASTDTTGTSSTDASSADDSAETSSTASLGDTGQQPVFVASAPATPDTFSATVDEAETISRTMLLAQRTADTTVAEAQAEADRIAREAGDEASRTLDSTREMSARLLEEAREEARTAGDEERGNVEAAVNALAARRDFLESDVDHLERHLADERSRLREAATTLLDLTDRVPGGMGPVGRPLLSAAGDERDDTDLDVTAEPGDDVDALSSDTDSGLLAFGDDDYADSDSSTDS